MDFLKLLIESNIFNFLIMIAIFVYVAKKLQFVQKLDDTVAKIKETIEKSEEIRRESEEELNKNVEKTKNIALEIEEIEKNGQQNLISIEEKLNKDSENQINSIKLGADKIIDAKEKEIISHLSKKTIIASIEVAKKHIINLLERHPDYHRKLIKDSIEELNRLG